MVDLTSAYTALKNADAAGDVEAATKLAKYIKSQLANQTLTPSASSEGMPTSRPKAVQGLTVAQERGDLPEYSASEAAKATLRGAAKGFGGLGDIGGSAIGLPTSEEIAQTFKLKETPAEYAPFEFLGSIAGPQVAGKILGGALRLGESAFTGIQNWLNPKNAALILAADKRGPEIINSLRNAPEFVPGSVPTAGVAAVPAGAPKYAALQEEVAKTMPTEYYARQQAQNAARIGAVQSIGQDEAALAAARGARESTTAPLYKAARGNGAPVDTGPVLDKIDDIIKNNPGNPELLTEMQRIRKGLVIPETPMAPELARTKAREVASSLDGIKTALAKEENKFITGELTDIKNMLVDAIPGMKTAQETFKAMSKPVNKMEVGQYLEGKLTSAVNENKLTPAAFASAVENAPATIKRATGMPRFESMSQILDPSDMAKLNGIRADLARESEFATQLGFGRKAGDNIPATGEVRIPNMMSRISAVANKVMTALQGRINKKVAIELATEMLDPQLAANAMEKALVNQANQAGRKVTAARASDFANQLALMSGAGATVNNLAGR